MHASSTPATALLSRAEAPKLRSSCDGCGAAKVRCDRGQPECSRCATLGLACVYGRSRKFGKPPRKRPGARLNAVNSLACKKRATWTTENHNDITAVASSEKLQAISEPPQLSYSDMVANILPTSSDNTMLNLNQQNQLSQALFTPLSFDDWPQFDIFGAGLDVPCIPQVCGPDIRRPTSPSEPAGTTRPSFSNHQSHSCPRESYEILADLICPGPSLHAPTANVDTVSTQLDHVLHFSRKAIDRLGVVLRCPCAKSGHRAMVHASIISRILIWYQQAGGWAGGGGSSSSSWSPRTSAVVDASTSHSSSMSSSSPSSSPLSTGTAATTTTTTTTTTSIPTLTQSTGFAVAHVPVSVGSFRVEDQSLQAAFRTQLVMSELKAAAGLIDLFTSHDSDDAGAASGVAGLCSYLGAWLRGEHAKIVRVLRSRLSALGEELES